ncbi:MAG TPA: DUF3021 domain-containing protein [Clostridia bacterium]|jgi:uncharacterized protein (DUF697 family)|nr:DUF3021 domain-containing protein [Clostridia bacterium]
MKAKLIIRTIIGFIIGAILGNVITLIFSVAYGEGVKVVFNSLIDAMGMPLAITLQTILSGIFGIVCIAGTCVFDIDSWSLLKATVVHAIPVLTVLVIISAVLKWIEFKFVNCVIMIAIGVVAYALIWLIMYLIWKAEIKKMNEELEEYKKRINGDNDSTNLE